MAPASREVIRLCQIMGSATISNCYLQRVEAGINRFLPASEARPARIHGAMRYSMAAGGKRLRPVLVLAAADLVEDVRDAVAAAVAVECVHTYSLIHDDLPAIDNSDLRRGRPTSHKQFDEATAVLAGDALLTDAFRILGEAYADVPSLGLRLVAELGRAASSRALIGGQMEDILGERRRLDAGDLDYIHLNKTAAMIEASLVMGLLHGDPDAADVERLRRVGRGMGLAFQIVDDILDATASSEQLGKTSGRDAELHKSTYVSLHGIEASRRRVETLTTESVALLARWGDRAGYLVDLTRQMAERTK